MSVKAKLSVLSIALSLAAASTAVAQSAPQNVDSALEKRVTRIERLLEGQLMGEMLQQLEQIQRETQSLRSSIESSQHKLRQLQSRQKDLYQDIDRRLNALERAGVQVPATPSQPGADAGAAGSAQSGLAISSPTTGGAATQTRPAAVAPTPPAPTGPSLADQQKDYDAAFALLQEGRYERAEVAFGDFLKKFPQGSYAGNAQYWLAESLFLQRNFDGALSAYQALLDQHADSSKIPNAKTKMGFVHYEKGEWAKARTMLEDVVKNHPNTSAQRNARNRLNLMAQEGR